MLLLLWEEESLTQKELSRRQQIEEPTAARTLQRMERDGLIRRAQDRDDNRRRRVVLTERGRELCGELVPAALEVNALATHGFPTMRRSASSACSATSWRGWAKRSAALSALFEPWNGEDLARIDQRRIPDLAAIGLVISQ